MATSLKRDRSDTAKGPRGLGKKPKVAAPAGPLGNPIRPGLLSDASSTLLRAQHDSSAPYRHVVIDNLCQQERMRAVHEECVHTMKTSYKETDLFKVYQTGDLAALGMEGSPNTPELIALRSALYGPEFRAFVSRITGVDDLTDRVDCSANAYTQGCHLLCHDDVIGTRRVSYIIYITDPDEGWSAADGGALELYPLHDDPATRTLTKVLNNSSMCEIEQGIPATRPSGWVLPNFNRMALFAVQPGRSYHSVQEVYAPEKVRLSISGWYHGPCAPLGSDQASLAQVMSKGDSGDQSELKHTGYAGLTEEHYFAEKVQAAEKAEAAAAVAAKAKAAKSATSKPKGVGKNKHVETQQEQLLSAADVAYLSKYLNSTYLNPSQMAQIREEFIENSAVQLADFLAAETGKVIAGHTCAADSAQGIGSKAPKGYDVGVGDGWSEVGPPHKGKYMQYSHSHGHAHGKKKAKATSAEQAGETLSAQKEHVFQSEAFARYLTAVTTLKPVSHSSSVRRFRAGLDYTVAHYGAMTEVPVLDATLCFVNDDSRLEALDDKQRKQAAKMAEAGSDEDVEDEEEEEEEEGNIPDWDTGDCGGFEVYISADTTAEGETAEAAEVFKVEAEKESSGGYGAGGDEDESTLLSVTPGFNTLSLVMRDKGLMRFVKYVNSTAAGSRWDICTEYKILQEPDSDAEDEEEEEEEDEEGNEAEKA